MDKFKGLKALRKTIELVLQKLNMYQDKMNEISREELLEIMGNNDLDLSWIASQESVDELKGLITNTIEKVDAAIALGESNQSSINQLNDLIMQIGSKDDPFFGYDIAPLDDIQNWTYEVDSDTSTVILKTYNGTNPNLIVYDVYNVGGDRFRAKLVNLNSSISTNKKITSIKICDHVNVTEFTSLKLFTAGLDSLQSIDFGMAEYRITNMCALFSGKMQTNLTLNHFPSTKLVTDMTEMFLDSNMDYNIIEWSFDSVVSMDRMFQGYEGSDNIVLSGKTFPRLLSATSLFEGSCVTSINMSNINMSSLTDGSRMFYNCNASNIDITGFTISSPAFNATEMFYGLSNITDKGLVGLNTIIGWRINNATKMFGACPNITVLDLSNILIDGSVMDIMKGSNIISLTFKPESIISDLWFGEIGGTPARCQLEHLDIHDCTWKFKQYQYLFSNIDNLQDVDVNMNGVKLVGDLTRAFNNTNIDQLNLTSFDVSGVTNAHAMFRECRSSEIDISGWDLSNANMNDMLSMCPNLTKLNLSNVIMGTSAESAFSFNRNLTEIYLSGINTSNVTNMTKLFKNCSSLTSLDLTSFDTSNVTNMTKLFEDCSSLTSLDLTSFDTSNVTDASSMFSYCSKLKEISVSRDKWIISSDCNIEYMFSGCGTRQVTYVD